DGRQGAYTARKETKQRGESYWYAYRKRAGKLKKTYLGKSTDLTLARLEEVADLLSHDAAAQSIMLPAPFPPSSSRTSAALGAVEGKTAGDTEPGARASAQPDRAHDPLLATRIQRPRMRPHLVHRSVLSQRLMQAHADALTLLSAPAGFGKTSALADWLNSFGIRAAWLSLEPEDNEPARFLSSVIAALQTLDPAVGG